MNTRTLFWCMGFLTFLSWGAMASPENKLAELEKLPIGLKVVHTPEQARAVHNGPSGRAYTWIYKTSVTATNGPVVVEEFGAFSWFNNQWVFSNFTGKPFTPQNFADWYSCPRAEVAGGRECADPSNWNGADDLHGGKIKWYFIGVTPDGHRVKGEAIVEKLPELVTK